MYPINSEGFGLTIVCASCHERLWSFGTTSDGRRSLAPAQSEVPFFSPAIRLCPLCDQEMGLWKGKAEGFFLKDNLNGKTHVLEKHIERASA